MTRENGRFVLRLELPFATRDDVSVSRHADELLLQVGGWRRTLVLPRVLLDVPTGRARLEGNVLRIDFRPPAVTAPAGNHA